jgi:ribosome biogenesis GTPase / thiamine phosphate phosphatase
MRQAWQRLRKGYVRTGTIRSMSAEAHHDRYAALRPMGWKEFPALVAKLADSGSVQIARVIGQHRSAYEVARHSDDRIKVQPPAGWTRPRFDPELRAVVGDWVLLDAEAKHILELLPRHALLKRGAAGEHLKVQPIAANVDYVLVVTGLDHDFNPRRLERYLLVIRASGASPVLVLTKSDLYPQALAKLEALQSLRDQQIPIHAINAKDPAQCSVLHAYLQAGNTLVLVGSSGAGKSTLTNTLLGSEKMKTAAVRENDSRGRHTTTHRALIALPQGACLIDTPGMRELKLSGDEDLVEGGFADIDALASDCRFRDCAHSNEPGCAVRAAIESGGLEEARYAHFIKLRDELDAAAQTLAQRRSEEKQSNKSFNKRLKDKYGRR